MRTYDAEGLEPITISVGFVNSFGVSCGVKPLKTHLTNEFTSLHFNVNKQFPDPIPMVQLALCADYGDQIRARTLLGNVDVTVSGVVRQSCANARNLDPAHVSVIFSTDHAHVLIT
jgi:hypothetical protein